MAFRGGRITNGNGGIELSTSCTPGSTKVTKISKQVRAAKLVAHQLAVQEIPVQTRLRKINMNNFSQA